MGYIPQLSSAVSKLNSQAGARLMRQLERRTGACLKVPLTQAEFTPKDSGQPLYPAHEQAPDCPYDADQRVALIFQIELKTGLRKHRGMAAG